jgi:hypothetical protein
VQPGHAGRAARGRANTAGASWLGLTANTRSFPTYQSALEPFMTLEVKLLPESMDIDRYYLIVLGNSFTSFGIVCHLREANGWLAR